VKGIRGRLEQLIGAEGKEMVLVGHSYAGAPTSQSVKGFEKHERQAQGNSGGIVRHVIMHGFALKERTTVMGSRSAQRDLPPFIRAEVGLVRSICDLSLTSPQGNLLHPLPGIAQHCYNDLLESEQE